MPRISWSDAYSVKIQSIDDQHKRLIRMINDLDDAIKRNAVRKELGSIFTQLIEYTRTHFKWEEDCFDKFGYPETDVHKKQHADLVKQVLDLKNKFDADSSFTPGYETLTFLTEWLIKHIQGTDMRYSQFLVSKGVT